MALLTSTAHAAPGLNPVVQAVAQAANKKTPGAVQRYAATPNALAWLPKPPADAMSGAMAAMFNPNPWQGAVLQPPYTNGGAVAVFHTWHAPESEGDHIHPLLRSAGVWKVGPELLERDPQGYRITHHDLNIRIVPASKKAIIRDTFSVLRLPGAPRVAYLRISDDFSVSSLRAGKRAVPFRQAGGVVAVPVPAGKSVSLTMEYAGVVDHKFASAIQPTIAVMNAYYYPTLARFPSTADVTLTVPKGWEAVTQGELLARSDHGVETTFRYHNTVPVNYFSLDAGKYFVRSRKLGRVTLYTYLTQDKPSASEKLLDALAFALPIYERRFSAYPYSRYSIMDGGAIMSGVALEGYSLASYGTLTLSPYIVSHELSHTWWGGVIPNTYLRSWWNESFASYSDDDISRRTHGVTTSHPSDRPWWPGAKSVSGAPPATANFDTDVNAIAYAKGRIVLRMLQDTVGTPVFDTILRDFVRHETGALDTDWPDFRRSVERVTGQDWGWYFDQWIGRAGWPKLRLVDTKVTSDNAGGYIVTARLVQDGAPYRLFVPVRLETDGEAVVAGGQTEGKSITLTIPTKSKPKRLVLDPEFTIPRDMTLYGETGTGNIVFDTNGKPSAETKPDTDG